MTGYPASYFENYGGTGDSYIDNPATRVFFGNVAIRLIQRFRPHSVLDAGCAIGYLVEALRGAGVAAWGIDASAYAIEHARSPHCKCQSLIDPINGTYDLVTAIEVLEHIPEQDAEASIANLCSVTNNVVFSSTAIDFDEPTHVNVRPAEYWTVLFEHQGFERDEKFSAPWLAEWAMLFRRRGSWPS